MNNRVKVETKDGTTKLKGLQKELEQLKKLVFNRNLDAIVEECYLEVAAEKLEYKRVWQRKKAKRESKKFASLSKMSHCFELKREAYFKYKGRANKRPLK